MNVMMSQVSSGYSTVYSGTDQRKHQSFASLAFVRNSLVTGEFPTQRVSNAENVSIWWRHHVKNAWISSQLGCHKYSFPVFLLGLGACNVILKPFPQYWPFVRGIDWSPVDYPRKWPVKRSVDVSFGETFLVVYLWYVCSGWMNLQIPHLRSMHDDPL